MRDLFAARADPARNRQRECQQRKHREQQCACPDPGARLIVERVRRGDRTVMHRCRRGGIDEIIFRARGRSRLVLIRRGGRDR